MKPDHPLAKYVGIADAARAVGLSQRTVRRHAADPTAPFFRPRCLARVLVHLDEYAAWLRGETPAAVAAAANRDTKETHHA